MQQCPLEGNYRPLEKSLPQTNAACTHKKGISVCVCTTCYINGTLRFPFKSHTQLSFTLTMVWEIPRYVVINLRWFRASMIVKIAPSGDLRGRRACCRKRSIEQTNDLLDSHTECNINNKFLLLFPIFSLKAISIVSIHLNLSQRVSPWSFCHCWSLLFQNGVSRAGLVTT